MERQEISTKLKDFGLSEDVVKQTARNNLKVEVTIDGSQMVEEFAKAFFNELDRINSRLIDREQITVDQLKYYFQAAIQIRIDDVNNKRINSRLKRDMLLPAWIEFTLTQIGIHTDSVHGLTFIPVSKEDMSIDADEISAITQTLTTFRDAGAELWGKGFPTDIKGDPNFMTMAVINDEVCSYREDNDPLSVYLCAFLNSMIVEQNTLTELYRVTYDSVSDVVSAMRSANFMVKRGKK